MRTKYLVVTVMVIFLGLSAVQAQGISFGISGGVNVFTGDVTKTPQSAEDVLERGFTGYTAEPAFGVKAKFGLPLLPLSIVAHANYTMMKGSVEYQGIKYESESDLLTVGAGAELSLFPGPLSPYLAADILYNSFGKTKIKITGLPDDEKGSKSAIGFGIGVGIEFTLLPMIDMDISAKYNINGEDAFGNNANTVMIQAHLLF